MKQKIALAGNPNSGKTTLYNVLTGSNAYVGNWPGVTVEKKEGPLKTNADVVITDLPGIYSLSPYTPEEVVTRDYLSHERPHAIINIVDSTSLERNLYLTTQLLELNTPVVIALNMSDIVEKNGDSIDHLALADALGCEVVAISAIRGEGCYAAVERAILLSDTACKPAPSIYSERLSETLSRISNLLLDICGDTHLIPYYAIKLFERDKKIADSLNLPEATSQAIEQLIRDIETLLDDDSESIVANERYTYITGIIKRCMIKKQKPGLSMSDRIDRVAIGKWTALPLFAIVMFALYYLSVTAVGSLNMDWLSTIASDLLDMLGIAAWLHSLITDGIIGGVGAVLGFLPQLLVLFFLLSLLEDCGYMSRIAFILDRLFRRFGLSGKSVIPILIGTGCSVPGIMASRTIENEADRRITIITTSFMPCSAKLPVIAFIGGTLFPGAVWIALLAYFIGIFAILVSGLLLKKLKGFKSAETPFVMELPAYHIPKLKNVLTQTLDRGKSFLVRAGTVIFVASALIWFLSNFDFSLKMAEPDQSILAALGKTLAWVFQPLGFGSWQAAVATLTGLVAKENIVGTLGVLQPDLNFTAVSGLSFLIFNLLCAPCVAAIGAISREMGSLRHTLFALLYQTGFAYIAALLVYQLGMFIYY